MRTKEEIIDLLGLCYCGRPEDALKYLRAALRVNALLSAQYGTGKTDWDTWFPEVYRPATNEVFHGDSGAEYFMWYFLADKNLTHHGGAVPGWLTDLGKEVLAELEALDLDLEDDDD